MYTPSTFYLKSAVENICKYWYILIQGYSLKYTETKLVSSATALFYKISYLFNGIVPSSCRTRFFLISSWHHFFRLVTKSYFKKWYVAVRYTLENMLVPRSPFIWWLFLEHTLRKNPQSKFIKKINAEITLWIKLK